MRAQGKQEDLVNIFVQSFEAFSSKDKNFCKCDLPSFENDGTRSFLNNSDQLEIKFIIVGINVNIHKWLQNRKYHLH